MVSGARQHVVLTQLWKGPPIRTLKGLDCGETFYQIGEYDPDDVGVCACTPEEFLFDPDEYLREHNPEGWEWLQVHRKLHS